MPGTRTVSSRWIIVLAAASLTAVLAGCRENEQGRPLSFDKGTYGGQVDQSIDAETRRQLQDRVRLQNFN